MDQRPSPANDLQIIHHISGIGHQRRNRFACVDYTSATQTKHQVAAVCSFYTLSHDFNRRFPMNLVFCKWNAHCRKNVSQARNRT